MIVGSVSGPACSVSEGLPPDATLGHQMADDPLVDLVLSFVHTSLSRRSCLPGTSCSIKMYFLKLNMVDDLCHLVCSNLVIQPGMVDQPVANHRGMARANKS